MEITLGQQYNVREKSTAIYTVTLTLIAMQAHQKKQNRDNVVHHHTW